MTTLPAPKNPEEDAKQYRERSHLELIQLTRALWNLPLGELTDLHKRQAVLLSPVSPSTVFVRAVVFARLVAAQERGGAP